MLITLLQDDHGLQNQVWSPYEERVKLCAEAVRKANHETGRNSLYAPCLNGPSDIILSRAYYAKKCGAGAIMVLPGIVGWDVVRVLASDNNGCSSPAINNLTLRILRETKKSILRDCHTTFSWNLLDV